MNNLASTYLIGFFGTLIPILSIILIGAYLVVRNDPSKLPRIKQVLIYAGVLTLVISGVMIYTITSMSSMFN